MRAPVHAAGNAGMAHARGVLPAPLDDADLPVAAAPPRHLGRGECIRGRLDGRTPAAGSRRGATMGEWTWSYEGYDPARERLREALCTLGNGYFATRGAAPETVAAPTTTPAPTR